MPPRDGHLAHGLPFEGVGAGSAQQSVELLDRRRPRRRTSGPHHDAARRPGALELGGLGGLEGRRLAVPVAARLLDPLTEAPEGGDEPLALAAQVIEDLVAVIPSDPRGAAEGLVGLRYQPVQRRDPPIRIGLERIASSSAVA